MSIKLTETQLKLLRELNVRAQPLSGCGGSVLIMTPASREPECRIRVSTGLRPLIGLGLAHYPDSYTCAITPAGRDYLATLDGALL